MQPLTVKNKKKTSSPEQSRWFKNQQSMPKKFILLGLLGVVCMALFLLIGLDFSKPATLVYALKRRLKVVGSIVVVGYAVAHSTITFQTISNNQILTPSVMGLDSLYLFLQTIVVYTMGGTGLAMMTGWKNFLVSLVLMVGMSLLLFRLMFQGEEQNVYFLVLVGMVFGTLFGGLSNFLQILIDPNEYDILLGRMFASFSNINVSMLLISAIITGVVCIISIPDYRTLDVVSLGKSQAINLGVNYNRLVLKSLISISILTSVSTILVGPVTFLGILVASLARRIFKTYKHNVLILGTFIVSLVMLFLGMLLTERVFHFTTPLSVLLNFFGGVYFIFMLVRESRYSK